MTLSEIISLTRDEAGTTEHSRISNSYIRFLVNSAQKDFARRSGLFIGTKNITISTTKSEYSIKTDPDFLITDLINTKYISTGTDGNRVVPVKLQDLLDMRQTEGELTGTPVYYAMQGISSIAFHPEPDPNTTIKIIYLKTPTDLNNLVDVTELPEQFEFALVNWCIYRIKKRLKDRNADTYLQLYMDAVVEAISLANNLQEEFIGRMKSEDEVLNRVI